MSTGKTPYLDELDLSVLKTAEKIVKTKISAFMSYFLVKVAIVGLTGLEKCLISRHQKKRPSEMLEEIC